MSEARRILDLQLTARREGLIRRGALLVEDALRTAHLPGGSPSASDGGRLLVIRHLDLGVLRADRGPSSVALTLERELRSAAAQAVSALDPQAGRRPAVHFAGRAEAAAALALRLAGGEGPTEWFWPLAVPGYRQGMPRDVALRTALLQALAAGPAASSGAAGAATAPAVAVHLVATLAQAGRLEGLLAALRPVDGPALLAACGWSGPRAAPAAAPPFEAPPLQPAALHWVRRWGGDEPRALWLAAVLLIADKPARLLSPDLLPRARTWLRRLVTPAPADPVGETAEAAPTRRLPHRPEAEAAPAPQRRQEPAPAPSPVPEARPSRPEATVTAESFESPEPPPAPVPERLRAEAGERVESGGEERAEEPREATALPRRERPREIMTPEPAPVLDARLEPPPPPEWPDARPSSVAGLLFVLPVLVRLGLAEQLVEQPQLIEADLPRRLLSGLARRLGAPADDPMLTALAPSAVDGERPVPFVAPAAWRSVAGSRAEERAAQAHLSLHPLEGVRRGRLLLDSSGRLPLALWQSPAPQAVRLWTGERGVRRGPSLPEGSPEPDFQLLRAWRIALGRWLRRVAGVSLADLVRRPGHLSATATHLDVVFGLRQVDLRIRRAGLDVDPGWLPWLGRVVSFHYVEGGRRP